MSVAKACGQFKVWAFLKRNAALLSHDEYRAGHVGYHCANTRRLKGIRGYTVNIHDENEQLSQSLASSEAVMVRREPANFLTLWDGCPAVYFDSWEHWTQAGTQEPTRATAKGLAVDDDWTLADGPFLFDRVGPQTTEFRSYHTRVEEHVIKPVMRAETRPSKLLQFYRAAPGLSWDAFCKRLLTDYAPLCAGLDQLNGLVTNFRDRDIDAAVSGYYPEAHWCFSDEGRAERQVFFDLWDGANEYFFDTPDAFIEARRNSRAGEELCALEDELFEAVWFVHVDENVIVMPNRLEAPNFYYR